MSAGTGVPYLVSRLSLSLSFCLSLPLSSLVSLSLVSRLSSLVSRLSSLVSRLSSRLSSRLVSRLVSPLSLHYLSHAFLQVLSSLSNLTITPAAIYVNLPYKNGRTGKEYVVPDWLVAWSLPLVSTVAPNISNVARFVCLPVPDWPLSFALSLVFRPGVKVLRTEVDYGPLTKLVPALKAENDPETIIVTVDDDKVAVWS
jgi:hypothetical protein